jgi:hypothetical protein
MRPVRPRRRTAAGLVALLVVPLLLAGCSDAGEGDGYCAALTQEKKTLDDLADQAGSGTEDTLTPTVAAFSRLQAAAPDELQDEWETVVVAYQALVDAVQAAGIDPADYDPDHPPAGVSKDEAHRLAAVASKLASARVVAATSGIEEHAQEVCDVDFSG